MSEAASTHVALAKSTRNSATARMAKDGDLLPSLAPLLHAWLPRQRWFAGKGRPVTGFSLVSATEMLPLDGTAGPGLLHLLVRAEQPARQGRPAEDCYQLLLGARTSLPPLLAVALLGLVGTPPTAVFVGKLEIFTAAMDGGLAWLVVIAALNTLASLFYYLRWITPAFRPAEDDSAAVTPPSRWARAVALTTAALTLLLGIGSGIVLNALGASG